MSARNLQRHPSMEKALSSHASKAYPSLFGRFTAVLSEHQQLGSMLRRLRESCSSIERGTKLPPELEPAPLVDGLFEALSEHFAREESDSYFGTVRSEEPRLAPSISALEAEHACMLETLGVLRALSADKARWSELPVPTLQLIERLEQHERAETGLMCEFFSRDDVASSG